MTVLEIAEAYLKREGNDGLWHSEEGCGCFLADFMPCGTPSPVCIAGHRGTFDGPEIDLVTMLQDHLDSQNLDGLVNARTGCWCVGKDLLDCTGPATYCEAGVKVPCDCDEGHEFHIMPREDKEDGK